MYAVKIIALSCFLSSFLYLRASLAPTSNLSLREPGVPTALASSKAFSPLLIPVFFNSSLRISTSPSIESFIESSPVKILSISALPLPLPLPLLFLTAEKASPLPKEVSPPPGGPSAICGNSSASDVILISSIFSIIFGPVSVIKVLGSLLPVPKFINSKPVLLEKKGVSSCKKGETNLGSVYLGPKIIDAIPLDSLFALFALIVSKYF